MPTRQMTENQERVVREDAEWKAQNLKILEQGAQHADPWMGRALICRFAELEIARLDTKARLMRSGQWPNTETAGEPAE